MGEAVIAFASIVALLFISKLIRAQSLGHSIQAECGFKAGDEVEWLNGPDFFVRNYGYPYPLKPTVLKIFRSQGVVMVTIALLDGRTADFLASNFIPAQTTAP